MQFSFEYIENLILSLLYFFHGESRCNTLYISFLPQDRARWRDFYYLTYCLICCRNFLPTTFLIVCSSASGFNRNISTKIEIPPCLEVNLFIWFLLHLLFLDIYSINLNILLHPSFSYPSASILFQLMLNINLLTSPILWLCIAY